MVMLWFSVVTFAHPPVDARLNDRPVVASGGLRRSGVVSSEINAAIGRVLYLEEGGDIIDPQDVQVLVELVDEFLIRARNVFSYDSSDEDVSDDDCFENFLMIRQTEHYVNEVHRLQIQVDEKAATMPSGTPLKRSFFYRQIKRIKREMRRIQCMHMEFGTFIALRSNDRQNVLNEAVEDCTYGLSEADAGAG